MGNLVTILVKPLARGREEEVRAFMSQFGTLISEREHIVSSWQISQHYRQFAGKKFFKDLISYYTGKVVTSMAFMVEDIEAMRSAIGSSKVDAGSFREQLVGDSWRAVKESTGAMDNGIHSSDSPEEGLREYAIWFERMPIDLSVYTESKAAQIDQVHTRIWDALELAGFHFTFAGGTQNGTAILSKPVDLDYRIFVRGNLDEAAKKLQAVLPDSFFDRHGYDSKLDANYIKFELNFGIGKADLAIVPVEKYRYKVSRAHLMDLLPASKKAEIRERKAEAYLGGKSAYEAEKAAIREEVSAILGL